MPRVPRLGRKPPPKRPLFAPPPAPPPRANSSGSFGAQSRIRAKSGKSAASECLKSRWYQIGTQNTPEMPRMSARMLALAPRRLCDDPAAPPARPSSPSNLWGRRGPRGAHPCPVSAPRTHPAALLFPPRAPSCDPRAYRRCCNAARPPARSRGRAFPPTFPAPAGPGAGAVRTAPRAR